MGVGVLPAPAPASGLPQASACTCTCTCLRAIASYCLHLHLPQGYRKLGFTRDGNATVYREWLPSVQAAALIGDFNNWGNTWMTKDQWGVWSIRLEDGAKGGGRAGAGRGRGVDD